MAELLLALGADPFGVDGGGLPVAAYATTSDADRPVCEAIHRAITDARSRARREPHQAMTALVACLALGDATTAERLVREDAGLLGGSGALHLLAKRGDTGAVRWLLDHGADANARWMHWDAEVTPLHLAALGGHVACARLLLDRGADPSIRDGKHDSDAVSWARFFGREEVRRLLAGR
jgi:ankyrin repeat protein